MKVRTGSVGFINDISFFIFHLSYVGACAAAFGLTSNAPTPRTQSGKARPSFYSLYVGACAGKTNNLSKSLLSRNCTALELASAVQ